MGIFKKLFSRNREFESYKSLHLPVFRSNEGLANNEAYLQSAAEQIKTLKEHGLINSTSKILDFGCGQGRLANGLLHFKTPFAQYCGVDTQLISIEWCKKHIKPFDKRLDFLHLPARNARYNPQEPALRPLPFGDESFDLIFLNSVFSHMLSADIRFYLPEFLRLLSPGQAIYTTAFVEENVPHETENPPDYFGGGHQPLTRVRYEKQFFLKLFTSAGFEAVTFFHRKISRTGQSVIIARKPNK